MRPSQNLPLPPRIDTPFFGKFMRHSHNLPIPSRIYPPFLQLLAYVTLPESVLPSQNLPRPPSIYPLSLDLRPYHNDNLPIPPENLFLSHYMQRPPPPLNIYMRHSQNSPSDPKYTPTLNICDPSRIYPSFLQYMRCFQNLPRPPRIYPPPLLRNATLPESTPPSQNILSFKHPYAYAMVGLSGVQTFLAKSILPFLTSIREPLGIYSSLPEYTPSLFLHCDSHRIYPSLLPE